MKFGEGGGGGGGGGGDGGVRCKTSIQLTDLVTVHSYRQNSDNNAHQ